ncbi:MAG: tRNA (adenosine(37)-N6)-threonylcarbamoyltransferase complex dimerization subunit type 1 TsaB [bacterium]
MGNGFFLGIETSSIVTGLALVKNETIHYELSFLTGSKHNETIFQLITDALKLVGIKVADLSGVGVSIGPGMFTSLRVGLALAKGLALPYQIPVKGINTLDALVYSIVNFNKNNGLVIPIIDARKEEVFTAFYRKKQRISEYLILKPEQLAARISDMSRAQQLEKTAAQEIKSIILVGNGLKKYGAILENIIPDGFNSIFLEAPLPATIAFEAQKSINSGDVSDPATLQPFYLRPTDAELKRHSPEVNV